MDISLERTSHFVGVSSKVLTVLAACSHMFYATVDHNIESRFGWKEGGEVGGCYPAVSKKYLSNFRSWFTGKPFQCLCLLVNTTPNMNLIKYIVFICSLVTTCITCLNEARSPYKAGYVILEHFKRPGNDKNSLMSSCLVRGHSGPPCIPLLSFCIIANTLALLSKR